MPEIIYSDNHLLCLDKPGGLLTQPSGTGRISLEEQGKDWIRQQTGKTGNIFLEAVHRIDAVACGVVLFARTSKALSRLNQAIREGDCSKEYRVLVEDCPKQRHAVLQDYMVHDEHRARIVEKGTPNAAMARLEYWVLDERGGIALLKVLLCSGRYHQIRAQFAHLGNPIVGDRHYGAHSRFGESGAIALQHYCLKIRHPVTHNEMSFHSKYNLI